MIQACFDGGKSAAVSGAYQYDTGQRILLRGLPSPQALQEMDEPLSGGEAAVLVQYGCPGEQQTEDCLARYDAMHDAWMADVPDKYLTRHEAVHLYVYVYYGNGEGGAARAKTMYEGVFLPRRRPAPGGTVTQEQLDVWEAILQEVTLQLSAAQLAAQDADAASAQARMSAQEANDAGAQAQLAGGNARKAQDALNAMAGAWANAEIETISLDADKEATAFLADEEKGLRLVYSIPRGRSGKNGEKGETGPADLTMRLDGTTLYVTRNQ